MRFEPFELERWLPAYRYQCEYSLAASVIVPLKYNDLIKESDLDAPIKIGPTNGPEELREEISALYSEVDKEGVLVTHGAAEANFLVLNYLLDRGDECIMLVPNYMQVWGIARAIGAKVKLAYLVEEEEYKPDLEKLKELVSKRTKAITITDPNNPTGAKLSSEEVHTICEIAEDTDSYVICDEVLRGLEIDGVMSPSPVDIYDKGISTRSISKLGMSGLRVGWIAARDASIVNDCWSYKDYTTLGNSLFNQHIATIALRNIEKIIQRDRRILNESLKVFRSWIEENNQYLSCVSPKAGATALPRYKFHMNSIEFCKKLIKEEGVSLSPGDFFKAPGHFRILYAGTDANTLKAALDRISRFLRGLK